MVLQGPYQEVEKICYEEKLPFKTSFIQLSLHVEPGHDWEGKCRLSHFYLGQYAPRRSQPGLTLYNLLNFLGGKISFSHLMDCEVCPGSSNVLPQGSRHMGFPRSA